MTSAAVVGHRDGLMGGRVSEMPKAKGVATGDFGNAIEATQIAGRRLVRLLAGARHIKVPVESAGKRSR
jgi:hypothetical protein